MTMFVCWRYTLQGAAGDADRTPLDAIATDGAPQGRCLEVSSAALTAARSTSGAIGRPVQGESDITKL
jgi:hypothetical protein